MDVFNVREQLVDDYSDYVRGFLNIKGQRIHELVDRERETGLPWPDPLLQLNPAYQPGKTIDELVHEGVLRGDCSKIAQAIKTGKPYKTRLDTPPADLSLCNPDSTRPEWARPPPRSGEVGEEADAIVLMQNVRKWKPQS